MPDVVLKFVDLSGGVLGVVLLLSLTAGLVAWTDARLRVAERGPNRDQMIRWLERDTFRDFYRLFIAHGLDWLDRCLGDVGRADLSWRRNFGGQPSVPDWTGPALDTCALLAVIYPMATVWLVWAFSGEGGPIADLLGLQAGADLWRRILVCFAVLALVAVLVLTMKARGRRSVTWLAVSAAGGLFGVAAFAIGSSGHIGASRIGGIVVTATCVIAVAGAAASGGPAGAAIRRTGPGTGAGAGVIAGAVCMSAVLAGAVSLDWLPGGVFAFVLTLSIAHRAGIAGRLGWFWVVFAPLAMFVGYKALSVGASAGVARSQLTPVLTFVVLPLANLPFDFASLGLTRALLRWGCRPGSPSPFFVGLLDLGAALVLIFPLAVTLIIAVQAADANVFRHSGTTLVNLPYVLGLMQDEPWDPVHSWIYVLLASTLIPSLVNASVGTLSLMTAWADPLRRWMLGTLRAADQRPDGWTGYAADRHWVAAAWAAQVFAAVFLTLCAFWSLVWTFAALAPATLPVALGAAQWLTAVCGGWFGLPPFG